MSERIDGKGDHDEGVDIPDELLQALSDLALLLRDEPDGARYTDYEEWARRLEESRDRIQRGDPGEPGHVLMMFGSMGSLNDLEVGSGTRSTMSKLYELARTSERALRHRDRRAAQQMSHDEIDHRHDDGNEQPAPGPADHGGHGGMATRELDEHGDERD